MWANVYAGEHYITIRPYPWAGSRPPCVLWGPFSCLHAPGHSTILSECDSGIFCPAGIYPKFWKKGSAIVFSHLSSDVGLFECTVSRGGFWHPQSSCHRGACVCLLLFVFQTDVLCVCSVDQCLWLLWPHELQPTRFFCPWDFPGKNTGVGCHFLLQGIFLPRDRTRQPYLPWPKTSLSQGCLFIISRILVILDIAFQSPEIIQPKVSWERK